MHSWHHHIRSSYGQNPWDEMSSRQLGRDVPAHETHSVEPPGTIEFNHGKFNPPMVELWHHLIRSLYGQIQCIEIPACSVEFDMMELHAALFFCFCKNKKKFICPNLYIYIYISLITCLFSHLPSSKIS